MTASTPSRPDITKKQLVLAKLIDDSGDYITSSNPVPVSATTLPLPTGAATSTKQDNIITELQKLIGFEIPAYDSLDITYVAAGNGAGEIETVIYKDGVSTVATLTLSYDASNRLNNVVRT